MTRGHRISCRQRGEPFLPLQLAWLARSRQSLKLFDALVIDDAYPLTRRCISPRYAMRSLTDGFSLELLHFIITLRITSHERMILCVMIFFAIIQSSVRRASQRVCKTNWHDFVNYRVSHLIHSYHARQKKLDTKERYKKGDH